MKIGMKAAALLVGIGSCNMASAASYTVTDLGTLGGRDSYGAAINNAGQVTGWADDASGNTAFLTRGGTMTNLGTLGEKSSAGTGINDAGQVTGWSGDSSGTRGFLYRDGTLTDLGTPRGSTGTAINDAGQVTGRAEDASGHHERAFLYRDGTLTDLGTPGGANSEGTAINNAGQVTGWFLDASRNPRAFLYSDGALTDLGSGQAHGINKAGQVVGATFGSAALFSHNAVTILDTLIPPGSGWVLKDASGINDAGQITGIGFINGFEHAYLLTLVPVPAAAWLLGSGLLGLAGMSFARRRTRLDASHGEIVA